VSGIASIADVASIEARGLPTDRPSSTYELIQCGAAIDPKAPALSFFMRIEDQHAPEVWDYQHLLEDITRAANVFHALGAGADTVIAFILPNLPETHFVIWGGEATGIVMAINPLLEEEAIAHLLQSSGASILVTLGPFPGIDLWHKVRSVLHAVPLLKDLILVSPADRVRGLRRPFARAMQMYGDLTGGRGHAGKAIRIHGFWSLMRRQRGDRLTSRRRFSPDDVSSYFCTGGTTGLPKIAVRRHRNEVANAWSLSQVMAQGVGPGKTVFCGLPLFHVNAVMVTGLLPFSRGAHVVLGTPQGYRGADVVKKFWSIVERHRINFFSGVPTLYTALLDVPPERHDISSLEYGLCGAAPLPPQVFRDFERKTGLKILEGYGLTEATCVSCVNPPYGERRVGSIGIRLPGQRMKVAVLDDGGTFVRESATDEPGALLVSGDNVFSGYRLGAQNKGLWIDLGDGRRWLDTGDLARQDQDGYFWLTGRKKELIIRGGHNIDPSQIEEPLHGHPSVQLVAAIGRPDLHAGEIPVAYVQPKPGATVTEIELLSFAKNTIHERAAIPKAIRIVEQMPLTGVGKIYKPALRRLETAGALRDALEEAGIALDSLEALDDPRGMKIQVRLINAQDQEAAHTQLARFSFPAQVSVRQ